LPPNTLSWTLPDRIDHRLLLWHRSRSPISLNVEPGWGDAIERYRWQII
jgi:hypothetical protein